MRGGSIRALVASVKAEEKSSSSAVIEAITGVGAGASSHAVDAATAVTTTVKVRPGGGGAGAGGGGGTGTEEGEMDKDLLCPICMQIIKDVFLTACGHSFCYMCIVTQLNKQNDCPCCGHYLTISHLLQQLWFQFLLPINLHLGNLLTQWKKKKKIMRSDLIIQQPTTSNQQQWRREKQNLNLGRATLVVLLGAAAAAAAL